MIYVLILMAAGAAAYGYTQRADPTLVRSTSPARRFRLENGNITVEEADGRMLHYYPVADLDYLAVRTSRGPYLLEMEFAGEAVTAFEAEPGVETMLGDLVRILGGHPPRGLDLSRFGEAMETSRKGHYVFLDARLRDKT